HEVLDCHQWCGVVVWFFLGPVPSPLVIGGWIGWIGVCFGSFMVNGVPLVTWLGLWLGTWFSCGPLKRGRDWTCELDWGLGGKVPVYGDSRYWVILINTTLCWCFGCTCKGPVRIHVIPYPFFCLESDRCITVWDGVWILGHNRIKLDDLAVDIQLV
ncbi:hypothetical protein G9A89_000455, partial [Geosiphon pyriformis]